MEDLYPCYLQKPRVVVVCKGRWTVVWHNSTALVVRCHDEKVGEWGRLVGWGGPIRICYFYFWVAKDVLIDPAHNWNILLLFPSYMR